MGSLYYGLSVVDWRIHIYKYTEVNKIKNDFDQISKTGGLDWVHGFIWLNPSISLQLQQQV